MGSLSPLNSVFALPYVGTMNAKLCLLDLSVNFFYVEKIFLRVRFLFLIGRDFGT